MGPGFGKEGRNVYYRLNLGFTFLAGKRNVMHWVWGSVYFFQTWGSHRVGVYIVHLELFKTIASEVGLTEKINIALENVAVYTIALITFCVWICTSVFCLCYPNIVKVSNFVRAKKLIWWENSSIWWRLVLKSLKVLSNSLLQWDVILLSLKRELRKSLYTKQLHLVSSSGLS